MSATAVNEVSLRSLPYPHPSSPAVSAAMRGNRRKDTKPEVEIRSLLHAAGHRFRKDYCIREGETSVRPDIVFTRRRIAVFVDGCFWHGCPEHGNQPKVNSTYWDEKLRRNKERDERVTAALRQAGWAVIRIWEHEPCDSATSRISAALARA